MNVKELTRRWWELIQAKDLERLGEVTADDVAFRGPGVELHGRAALRPFLAAYLDAFPDLKMEEVSWVVDGDQAIVEIRVTGTHTGTLETPQGPIPATGNAVVWTSCDHVRAAGGKLVAWTAYWDRAAFAAQLGQQRGSAAGGK